MANTKAEARPPRDIVARKSLQEALAAGPRKDPNAYRKNYRVMHIGVGPHREEKYTKLEALAEKHGVEVSVVVWAAIDHILAHPPAKITPPEGGAQVGTAPGFWIIAVTKPGAMKADDIIIKEVQHRFLVRDGVTFFRYDSEDSKSRNRAMKHAIKGLNQFRKLAGLPEVTTDPKNIPVVKYDKSKAH
jgi:hypothetical protein